MGWGASYCNWIWILSSVYLFSCLQKYRRQICKKLKFPNLPVSWDFSTWDKIAQHHLQNFTLWHWIPNLNEIFFYLFLSNFLSLCLRSLVECGLALKRFEKRQKQILDSFCIILFLGAKAPLHLDRLHIAPPPNLLINTTKSIKIERSC